MQYGKYTVDATLSAVNDDVEWYYLACPKHFKKVDEVTDGFQCSVCKKGGPLPIARYLLTTIFS